jgi:hypothetical protein
MLILCVGDEEEAYECLQTSKMMKLKKSSLPFFVLLSFIFISFWKNETVFAQDFIGGTVLSVDLERMEMELVPGLPETANNDGGTEKSIKVRLLPECFIINGRGERVLPGCVFPGGIVRLWGHREEGVFMVTDIRGYGGRGRGDPTGVRRRLQRMGPGYCPGGPGFHGGRE